MKLKEENINETKSKNINEAKGIKRKWKQKKEQKKNEIAIESRKMENALTWTVIQS